jgi:structural maintenance of chromosome 2
MGYVFGKAFVCNDAATARAVAFDKEVLTNCVTVEAGACTRSLFSST